MVRAVRRGGVVLDLQVIRPDPVVEARGGVVCAIDGGPLFRTADTATAAIDALVRTGRLVEDGVDDHDVRKHYIDGAELVADIAGSRRSLPPEAVAGLSALAGPGAVLERCRLRRLVVV
jgi:hypothetical protein